MQHTGLGEGVAQAREPVASLIIPAHNEALVIGRLLEDLVGVSPAIEVIVVCNGCADDTAEIAWERGAALDVRVIDIATASKAAALNAGDQAASAPSRLYVDADVRVSADSVLDVVATLRSGGVLAARPPIQYDTSRADGVVRAFYRARTRTHRLMTSLWGAGFVGVGPEGRARWREFPADAPDDYFVSTLFGSHQIAIIQSDPVIVTTPRTARALLRTLRRVYDLPADRQRSSGSTLAAVIRSASGSPGSVLDAIIYCCVAIAARVPLRDRDSVWVRDETSRQIS